MKAYALMMLLLSGHAQAQDDQFHLIVRNSKGVALYRSIPSYTRDKCSGIAAKLISAKQDEQGYAIVAVGIDDPAYATLKKYVVQEGESVQCVPET